MAVVGVGLLKVRRRSRARRKAMNVPELAPPQPCSGSPRRGSFSGRGAAARGRRRVGVVCGTLRRRDVFHIASKSAMTSRCENSTRRRPWFTSSSRAHSRIARRPSFSRPPWQASCRLSTWLATGRASCCGQLEVRLGGERGMDRSGGSVLPEALRNAPSPKHDCSGSGSSRCSAVFCLDPPVARQADRAEDRP